MRAVSSFGRASALHAGGGRFDPGTVHPDRVEEQESRRAGVLLLLLYLRVSDQ